jgi:hypothetical protein
MPGVADIEHCFHRFDFPQYSQNLFVAGTVIAQFLVFFFK